jgi:hypothetical protein
MSSDRDTTRIVRSWLEEGVVALPDRVLDGVLDQLPATRQRRSLWRWLGIVDVSANARLAMTAAAAVVVAIAGIAVMASVVGPVGPGAPSPTPTRTPPPTPAILPSPAGEATLTPGRYALPAFSVPGISLDVPAGWFPCFSDPNEAGVCSERELEVAALIVQNVVAGQCGFGEELRSPPPGPSVDELVAAISNIPGVTVTPAIDVSIDGVAGKELTLTAAEPASCSIQTWATSDRTNGMGYDEVDIVRILDVGGTRVLIVGAYHVAYPEAETDAALIRQLLDSVQIAR